MPSLAKIKEQQRKKEQLKKEEHQALQSRRSMELRLTKLQLIATLFDSDGWRALKSMFEDTLQASAGVFLDSETVLSDTELRQVRQEMVYANKLLTLDTDIPERIKLLREQISSMPAQVDEPHGR
jgi:hypothetical protein